MSIHKDEKEAKSLAQDILLSWQLRYGLVILTLALALTTLLSSILGVFAAAEQLATVASAFATVLLVSLTAGYAKQTQHLVEETQRDREQREEMEKRQRKQELDLLRRGLRKEIGMVQYFDQLAEEYQAGQSPTGIDAPRTIYEQNASKIGYLSEEEVDHIVEYYTRLKQVEEHMKVQSKMDTPVEMGLISEVLARFHALSKRVSSHIPLVSDSIVTVSDRTEEVRNLLRDLSEAQRKAMNAIDQNI